MALNKIIVGFVLLLLLSFAAIGTPIILQENNFYYEDREVGFWETLFKPAQQAVIESKVLSGQRATPETTVQAKLIYIPKYNAENYNIALYLYDITAKNHYGPFKTIDGGTKRTKNSRYEATIQFKPSTTLGTTAFNHNFGIVGVLMLQVKKSELTAAEISKASCRAELCWIADKFNEQGGIQTNAFNPPFLYYKSEATACKIEYVKSAECVQSQNIYRVYQNRRLNDCSIQKELLKICKYGEDCSNGNCIASASCKLTGRTVGNECINNILNQRIYNKDCVITNVPTGMACEIDLPPSDPCKDNACDSEDGIVCEDVTFFCDDGTTITTVKCENNEPILTGETCSGEPRICPDVCKEVFKLEPSETRMRCTLDLCGSGCGGDSITTFNTINECTAALKGGQYDDRVTLINYIKKNPIQITVIAIILFSIIVLIIKRRQ